MNTAPYAREPFTPEPFTPEPFTPEPFAAESRGEIAFDPSRSFELLTTLNEIFDTLPSAVTADPLLAMPCGHN